MKLSTLVIYGFILAVASGLGVMFSGLGTRWEWWDFRTGFTILRWGAYGALAASALCVLGLIGSAWAGSNARVTLAAIGLLVGLVAGGIPVVAAVHAARLPVINDITTDTANPPQFVAILPLRKDAPTPSAYPGLEVAAKQAAAYPDVKPLIVNIPPADAFDNALAVARAMGWKIVDSDKAALRIEATDTTFWFGFTDDIVVRITPDEARCRIDVRSVSRVGKSDLGMNAKRITAFLKRMQG